MFQSSVWLGEVSLGLVGSSYEPNKTSPNPTELWNITEFGTLNFCL